MIARTAGLSRACSVTCPRCGTPSHQLAGATRWNCPGCRAGFVVGDGPPSRAPSLRPGHPRPSAAPALRRGSTPASLPPARRPLKLSGVIAYYRITEGPILKLPSGHRDGRETAGRPVLQPGCFARSLHRRPVRLYLPDLSAPIASTEDFSLRVRDGRAALELTADVTSPAAQLLIREPAGGWLPSWRAVPVFDLSTAAFDHAFGQFHIREAELTAVVLSNRSGWSAAPLKLGR